MPADDVSIPFYRDQFLGSRRHAGLSEHARMCWVYSMLIFTDPRFGSPTRGCLALGNNPMSFDEWRRALGFYRPKDAQKVWDSLFAAGAFEWQEHDGKPFVHVYGFERNQNREKYRKYNEARDEKPAVDALREAARAVGAPKSARGQAKDEEARRAEFAALAVPTTNKPTQAF